MIREMQSSDFIEISFADRNFTEVRQQISTMMNDVRYELPIIQVIRRCW